jgi:hypothetical protein
MPVITVPGHGEFEFPDGMSDDEMSSHINKYLDEQSSVWNKVKSYGKAITSGAAKGVAGIADLPLTSSYVPTPLSLEEQSMLGVSAPIRDNKTGTVTPLEVKPYVREAISPYLHRPESSGEKLAEAGGEGIIGGLLGPTAPARTAISSVPRAIPWLSKVFHYGVAPSVAGEAVRQGTEGVVKIPGSVPIVGGKDISPALGMMTSVFSPLLTRGRITPNTVVDPVVAQRYRTAVEGGITPTAGKLFNDPRLINSELAARPTINKEQKDAFNRAISNEIGESTESMTAGGSDSYLGRNFRRIGNDFNRLERSTSINPNQPGAAPLRNPQIYNDLVNIASANPHHVPDIISAMSSVNPRFRPTNYITSGLTPQEAIHDAIFRTAGNGGSYTLPGTQYRQLRTALHSAADAHGSPQVANSMRAVANALDEAMERGIPVNMRGDWDRSRRQYAHALVAQDAIARQGAGARQMTPDQFKSSSQSVMGREPYLRRDLERNALSEAAGEFTPLKKTKLPQEPTTVEKYASYVPGATTALRFSAPIAGAAGYYLGHKYGVPDPFSPGIFAFLMGEGGRKAVTTPNPYMGAMNPLVQMYRKNQLLPLNPDQRLQRILSGVERANEYKDQ